MSPQFDAERARELDKLYTDVFVGRDADNPSITMRLDRIERTYNKIMAITTAVLIAVLVQLALKLVPHL